MDCGRQGGADIVEDLILFVSGGRGLLDRWITMLAGAGCGGCGWSRGVIIISGGEWLIRREPWRCLDVGTLV